MINKYIQNKILNDFIPGRKTGRRKSKRNISTALVMFFLLLGGGFTGIDFIICFIIYIYSTIFLSIYQVDYKGKGKQKRKGEGRKGKRRTDINNETNMDLLSHPGKGTQASTKYRFHSETPLKTKFFILKA